MSDPECAEPPIAGAPQRDPIERFAAQALMTVGALIFSLAGLCSAGFIAMGMTALLKAHDASDALSSVLLGSLTVAIFGGIPIAMGLFVFRSGRRLLKPWDKVFGTDRVRTAAGWAMLLVGLVATAAALVAAVATLWTAASQNFRGYTLMFLPLFGFGLAIGVPVGPLMMVEGYRLARDPTSPAARPKITFDE